MTRSQQRIRAGLAVALTAVAAAPAAQAATGPIPDIANGGYRTANGPIVRTVDKPSGFEWGDAAIGAGGGVIVAVLAGGLAVGGRRRTARRAGGIAGAVGRS